MERIEKAEIAGSFEVEETYEASIDWKGNNYLVLYGRHINGWFIAIPNHQISTEASAPSDTFYNMERLAHVMSKNAAKAIAEALCEHWEYIKWLREETEKRESQEKQEKQEEQGKYDHEKLNRKKVR